MVLYAASLVLLLPLAVLPATPTTCAATGAGPGEGTGDEAPAALGRVAWEKDHEAAFGRAKAAGKPVALLFQELPGCSTCVGFGQTALSHPLLVEALDELFVPLAVPNNEGGAAAAVLARYHEPAWNNPVMRFFAADGTELLPRADRVWTAAALAPRVTAALEASGAEVPRWLALARDELSGRRASVVLAMPCFWEGEVALGGLDAVLSARAGYLDGHEVVRVQYDPERTPLPALLRAADGLGCAVRVYARDAATLSTARAVVGDRAQEASAAPRAAGASDHLRRLGGTEWEILPLTPLQALRVNAALGRGRDPKAWLSPRQLALLERVRKARQTQPALLRGLERPDDLDALPAYDRALAERLDDLP